MSRLTRGSKRARHGATATKLDNLLRRMSIADVAALEFALEGYVDAAGNVETDSAEVFGVAGVASLPAADDKAEALVAYLGGDSNAPAIVATRNADAIRRLEAIEGPAKAGATYLFSSDARARVVLENETAAPNPLAEPTYKAETHEVLRKALDATIASASAGVGGGVTAAINAARSAYEAALATAKTGSKIS
jgi:hypothetical protein